jgi:uncharacterized OsmC-like protein
MNSANLKFIQSPIKEKYRNQPESAVFTLKAEGELGNEITCNIETGRTLIKAGLHPATGGNVLNVCSGDLLLQALVACAGVTLSAVATALDIVIKNGKVRAEGEIDFKGTLGISKDALVGFQKIHLSFFLDTDAAPEKLESLKKLTERYCVVYQTLVNGVKTEVNFEKLNSI